MNWCIAINVHEKTRQIVFDGVENRLLSRDWSLNLHRSDLASASTFWEHMSRDGRY